MSVCSTHADLLPAVANSIYMMAVFLTSYHMQTQIRIRVTTEIGNQLQEPLKVKCVLSQLVLAMLDFFLPRLVPLMPNPNREDQILGRSDFARTDH